MYRKSTQKQPIIARGGNIRPANVSFYALSLHICLESGPWVKIVAHPWVIAIIVMFFMAFVLDQSDPIKKTQITFNFRIVSKNFNF